MKRLGKRNVLHVADSEADESSFGALRVHFVNKGWAEGLEITTYKVPMRDTGLGILVNHPGGAIDVFRERGLGGRVCGPLSSSCRDLEAEDEVGTAGKRFAVNTSGISWRRQQKTY